MHRSSVLALLAATALTGSGCAVSLTTFSLPDPSALFAPSPAKAPLVALGPGTVFPTVEEAVYDALAHAHALGTDKRVRTRVRAGTIRSVEGGFTYEDVHVADRHRPDFVRYALVRGDVAHFAVYPSVLDRRKDARAERHSMRDRQNVDRRDPLHRPHYLLTPSLRVVVYEGSGRTRELASLAQGLTGSMAMR